MILNSDAYVFNLSAVSETITNSAQVKRYFIYDIGNVYECIFIENVQENVYV